jgi:hypothetical protein
MPPKKAKVKVRKTSKSAGTKQGVKININIDQSKKTRGVAPKPPVVRRMLPAFSAMPQGPSYLGAQQPIPSASDVGKEVFNQLLMENLKRSQSAYGFGGFQSAGAQVNQLFDGEYRAGRYGQPIVLPPSESDESRAINDAVFDDPETNSIVEANKLSNRGSRLPSIGENSIVELRAEERRDNDLDNLVLHEKKTAVDRDVSNALDENLTEEQDENVAVAIGGGNAPTSGGGAKKKVLPKLRRKVISDYDLPPVPTFKKSTRQELEEYYYVLANTLDREVNPNIKSKEGLFNEIYRIIDEEGR